MKYSIVAFLWLTAISLIASCTHKDTPSPAPPDPSGPSNPSNPIIITFTPESAAKDSVVEISGTGFGKTPAENVVTFNGKTAVLTSATSTKLTVLVPLGAGIGKITVQTNNKVTKTEKDFIYIQTVSTLAGKGIFGFANGADTLAEFRDAYGLTTDAAGNIYVADGSNNRIRKITPARVVNTIAGGGFIGAINGPAATSTFNSPHGLAVDPSGNIYIADAGNNMIRKITPEGVVSTLAGNGKRGFVNGAAPIARFNEPSGIAIDAAGILYVSDIANSRIRKFQ